MAVNITGRVKGRILATVRQRRGKHFVSFPLHSRLSLALRIDLLGPFAREREAVIAARAALRSPSFRAEMAALLRADREREGRILARAARFGPTG